MLCVGCGSQCTQALPRMSCLLTANRDPVPDVLHESVAWQAASHGHRHALLCPQQDSCHGAMLDAQEQQLLARLPLLPGPTLAACSRLRRGMPQKAASWQLASVAPTARTFCKVAAAALVDPAMCAAAMMATCSDCWQAGKVPRCRCPPAACPWPASPQDSLLLASPAAVACSSGVACES